MTRAREIAASIGLALASTALVLLVLEAGLRVAAAFDRNQFVALMDAPRVEEDRPLFLLDLIDKGVTGKDADAALGRANITVNKNAVPNDPRSPFVTSGLRIGTPAVTTRGFKEQECETLTTWMCDVLDDIENDNMIASVQQKVLKLCAEFPVYQAHAA